MSGAWSSHAHEGTPRTRGRTVCRASAPPDRLFHAQTEIDVRGIGPVPGRRDRLSPHRVLSASMQRTPVGAGWACAMACPCSGRWRPEGDRGSAVRGCPAAVGAERMNRHARPARHRSRHAAHAAGAGTPPTPPTPPEPARAAGTPPRPARHRSRHAAAAAGAGTPPTPPARRPRRPRRRHAAHAAGTPPTPPARRPRHRSRQGAGAGGPHSRSPNP